MIANYHTPAINNTLSSPAQPLTYFGQCSSCRGIRPASYFIRYSHWPIGPLPIECEPFHPNLHLLVTNKSAKNMVFQMWKILIRHHLQQIHLSSCHIFTAGAWSWIPEWGYHVIHTNYSKMLCIKASLFTNRNRKRRGISADYLEIKFACFRSGQFFFVCANQCPCNIRQQ
jgi:hypothetical protein